jgi:hypothetical protein
MLKLFRKKKKDGCPVCYDKTISGFGKGALEADHNSKLDNVEEIENIQIYKCSKCQTFFYTEGVIYNTISLDKIQSLKKFAKWEMLLDKDTVAKLEQIGITQCWSLYKEVPAKIEHINGETYDFATFIISDTTPSGLNLEIYDKIIFIDEVKSIEPSKYSLSKEIRNKTEEAEEMGMGFYPTVLKTKNNEKIVINGRPLFFKNEHIVGSELTLANEDWNHNKEYIYENEINNQVLIIVKNKKTATNNI